MSLLENIVGGLLGNTNESTKEEKPCSNCAGDCSIYPQACEECIEYKNKLKDQLYFVEHLEEFYDRYEIEGTGNSQTEIVDCLCCGAKGQTTEVCAYCGTVLRQGSGKIKVKGASEIPDPIQEVQDIIFDRHEIVKKYSASESTGILSTLVNMVTGGDSFGSRMTSEEIKATANEYGVAVGTYLAGLDNGVYLTASAKLKKQQEQEALEKAKAAQAQLQAQAAQRREEQRHHASYSEHGHPSHPDHHMPPQHDSHMPQYDRNKNGMPGHPFNDRNSNMHQSQKPGVGRQIPQQSGSHDHRPDDHFGRMPGGPRHDGRR